MATLGILPTCEKMLRIALSSLRVMEQFFVISKHMSLLCLMILFDTVVIV